MRIKASGLTALDRQQWHGLAVILLFQIVDGFHTVSASLAAPGIAADWQTSAWSIGLFLGAAQGGAILSAAAIGSLERRLSLRLLLIAVTGFMACGSILGLAADGIEMLVAGRILSGIGLGACNALTVGYASRTIQPGVRATFIAVTVIGINIGQIGGGLIAAGLLPSFGWRSIFITAACADLVLVPLLLTLPIRPRLFADEPAIMPDKNGSSPLHQLWRSPMRSLVLITIATPLLAAIIIHVLLNWLPTLVREMGLSTAIGTTSLSAFAAGGIAGSLIVARLIDRGWPPFGVLATSYGLAAAVLLTVRAASAEPAAMLLCAAMIGVTLYGAYTGLLSAISVIFPPDARVGLVGLATVATRSAGMIAPVLVGWLLARGGTVDLLFAIASALCLTLAAMTGFGSSTLRSLRGRSGVRTE